MINVPTYNLEGVPVGSVTVDEALLGGSVRLPLLRRAIAIYERRRWVGSHFTRGKGEVAGSGRKMYRQKHTGLARAGQRRVPHRRGGGVAFAIHNRHIPDDMPRQALRRALLSAMLARLQDGVVRVIDDPQLAQPKTRVVAELLEKLGLSGSCLLVTGERPELLWKSARNIAGVTVCRVQDLNAYVLLEPEHVLFTRSAMARFMEELQR